MTLPDIRNGNAHETKNAVECQIDAILTAKALAAQSYGPEFARLWALTQQRVLGGKMVRPVLFLKMLEALQLDASDAPDAPDAREQEESEKRAHGSSAPDAAVAVQLAAALELLHFSFLLHDDVIDGDVQRRGQPNMIGELRSACEPRHNQAGAGERDHPMHWAQSCAILIGDLLLAEVHQILARLDLGTTQRIRLLDLLAHTITESVAGEQLDVGLVAGVVPAELSVVLEMCNLKTSTYTFEFPLRAAATLAQASAPIEAGLVAAGRNLGLAFQLQDDLLSTFGDPALHGKDAFSDIREGKETAIIAYARMTSAWPSIEPHLGNPLLGDAEAQRVREALLRCGAEQFVRDLIDEQLRALAETLCDASAGLGARTRALLLGYADALDRRSV